MDVRSLRHFVSVYDCGNISVAAKKHHISQPSLSSAIANLEEQLGVQLFIRSKKGVRPTEDGERLYRAARRLISDASAIQTMFKPERKKQTLRVGVMVAIDFAQAFGILGDILRDGDYQVRIVRANEPCDVRIICEGDVRPSETFVELWRENFVVALPEGHPLSLKDSLVLLDLAGVPLIARDYCSTNFIDAGHSVGINFEIVASAFSEEWAIAMVDQGLGVAVLPETCIRPEHNIVTRRFSNMAPQLKVGLAYPKNSRLPECFRGAVDLEYPDTNWDPLC